jgi:hypothetical protein
MQHQTYTKNIGTEKEIALLEKCVETMGVSVVSHLCD